MQAAAPCRWPAERTSEAASGFALPHPLLLPAESTPPRFEFSIVLTPLREIIQYRSLLRDLVVRDLKVRYKRSALGIAWTMLNPLLMMVVFTVVFARFLRFPIAHFTVYFLCAFLLWNFVSQTTSWSTACFLGYAPLIRKIYVPKTVLILSTVFSGLVNLLLALVPLALIMVLVGHPFTAKLAFIP
ncbi:MAG: hypothetical protein E6J70_09185, partial [Deltaproteobacteria bacterium]